MNIFIEVIEMKMFSYSEKFAESESTAYSNIALNYQPLFYLGPDLVGIF